MENHPYILFNFPGKPFQVSPALNDDSSSLKVALLSSFFVYLIHYVSFNLRTIQEPWYNSFPYGPTIWLREVLRLEDRKDMIQRIRKALGRKADNSFGIREIAENLPDSRLTDVMPLISKEELLPKFEAELTRVAGIPHRAADRAGLGEILLAILSSANAAKVVLSRNSVLAELNVESMLRAWGKDVSVWPSSEPASPRVFAQASFAATVGITGVEFALAETGSLVVTSVTEGAQIASLAPPVHVALYRRSQLIASLDELLERLPVPRDPGQLNLGRSVVFITGSSRTADIEQILIRGVHGPGEVHAVLVEDACFR